MGRLRITALTLLLAVGGLACGGGDETDSGAPGAPGASTSSTSPAEAGAPAPANGASGDGAGGAGGQAPGSLGASGGGTTTPTTAAGGQPAPGAAGQPTKPLTPLEVTLQHKCVKAGSSQTITIKSLPGGGAAYDSYYADGKSGISEGFYGGNNGKQIPPEGTWTDTWVISPHAPKGQVRVLVQGSKVGYDANREDVYFDLVGATESCP